MYLWILHWPTEVSDIATYKHRQLISSRDLQSSRGSPAAFSLLDDAGQGQTSVAQPAISHAHL